MQGDTLTYPSPPHPFPLPVRSLRKTRILLCVLLCLSGCATVPAAALLVAPNLTAHLPDGTLVHPVLVVPSENVREKNAAFTAWEQAWPTKYRLRSR